MPNRRMTRLHLNHTRLNPTHPKKISAFSQVFYDLKVLKISEPYSSLER